MKKIETERKYIVKKPLVLDMQKYPSYTESRITQTYLEDPTRTHRVRRREYSGGGVEYTENIKERISGMSAIENEREICKDEYNELIKNVQSGTSPVFKTRRTVEYCGYVFEFDFYEPWVDTCIMEVELPSENTEFELPPFVEVVREVTGIKTYSNHSMAYGFPAEEKL